MMRDLFNPETRRWIYGVCLAAFGVLGVYGVLTVDEIAAWGFLAAAVCGLAASNVNDESEESND